MYVTRQEGNILLGLLNPRKEGICDSVVVRYKRVRQVYIVSSTVLLLPGITTLTELFSLELLGLFISCRNTTLKSCKAWSDISGSTAPSSARALMARQFSMASRLQAGVEEDRHNGGLWSMDRSGQCGHPTIGSILVHPLLVLCLFLQAMILDYKLTYPSGTATAMLIDSFHTHSGAELASSSGCFILGRWCSH